MNEIINKQQVEANFVLVPARVRYVHNLMNITHKTSCYITFTVKVAAMIFPH